MTKNYKFWNNIFGWFAFLVASIVYLSTIEPTASLWDCGEYIATAFKLEVGHPPGAPLFLMIARIFSLFAGNDVTQAAKMINALSGLASAFTIMFLFWTITHLAKKMVSNTKELAIGQKIGIIAAGLVGAFAYMFSDSFWFSAGEGEVYATSSLFTAVVFWAILKWEDEADKDGADRWIILIAYLMGLSIGVHLLNLLAIPAIIFVYYFKKTKNVNIKGLITASVVSVALLGVVMYGIILGVFKISAQFELFFINSMGMPYNTGLILHWLLLVASLAAAIYFSQYKKDLVKTTILASVGLILSGAPFISTSAFLSIIFIGGIIWVVYFLAKNNRIMLNTLLIGVTMILLGYSSITLVVVRSYSQPPIDENNPENVFALLSYINREQYGDRPLAKGQYYNAPILETKEGKPTYVPEDGKYVISKRSLSYVYDDRFVTIFPRMWSPQADHKQVYKQWGGNKGKSVTVGSGESRKTLKVPTFGENIRFFISYQIGHMYWRYLMWNFSGRQNDMQGSGGPLKGNWITGLDFLDSKRIGPQENLPDYLANNKARNKYYMLPFLLGILGIIYSFKRKPKDFSVVLLLFIMTGLAIVVYLNQYPHQPRERDYAYAGSFYAFAIWIGLGVLSLIELSKKVMPEKYGAILAGVLSLALVPGIMGKENWNDHDRSGRYTARDIAFNYLNSCEPNAILCTNGDNDTFPLWYAQEVEGIRTDVRVVNLMLFNTDWYIDQMQKKAYKSEPLPITIPRKKYLDGTNNQIYLIDKFKTPQDIKLVIDFVKDDNPATQVPIQGGKRIDFIPTKKLRINVDSAKVVQNGTVYPDDKIVPYIDVNLSGNYIMKSQLMSLDLLAHNDWDRPYYFVAGGHDDALGLENYFRQEGFAFRLVPVNTNNNSRYLDYGDIDTEKMYKNYMENFRWGRMNAPDVYLDYYTRRTLSVIRMRNNFARLGLALVEEGKKDSAIAVLDRCIELLPQDKMRHDIYSNRLLEGYYKAGAIEKANELAEKIFQQADKELAYYYSLKPAFGNAISLEKRMSLQMMQETSSLTSEFGSKEISDKVDPAFKQYYELFMNEMGASGQGR
ncbi:MAG: DUF2723 domain-containing protein [Bacteroidales bacterium]|nr:DUF2723 domain-containing protein [Bacteroidales bacterium]